MGFPRKPPFGAIHLISVAAAASLSACSTAGKAPDAPQPSADELRATLAQMEAKLDALEARLSVLNDKVGTTNAPPPPPKAELKVEGVSTPVTDLAGTPVEPPAVPRDPEAGFINDAAIGEYRKAMILFQSRNYAEAILAFSAFVERYADHPFAGAAQFHVGQCYLAQKEYRLALQEFQRVLTSYDRSTHVAMTLRQMAEAEERLRMSDEAAKHRQQLASLFGASPAAADHVPSPEAKALASGSREEKPAPAAVAVKEELSNLDLPPPTAPVPSGAKPEKRAEAPSKGVVTLDEPPGEN